MQSHGDVHVNSMLSPPPLLTERLRKGCFGDEQFEAHQSKRLVAVVTECLKRIVRQESLRRRHSSIILLLRNRTIPLLLFLTIFMFFASAAAESALKKFVVLRIAVNDKPQLEFLQSQYLNTTKFDFWREPTTKGQDVHVMLKDEQKDEFLAELQRRNFTKYEVMIDDVEKAIKRRAAQTSRRYASSSSWFSARLHDPPSSFALSGGRRSNRATVPFSLGRYHSFAEIINYMNSLAINFPDRVRVQPIGTTHEGRQIPLIRIGTNRRNLAKPAVWIDGGIHAREWVSPAAVLYFINQLTMEYDTQPLIRSFVDQIDWYIVPLLNPDGYEYSRSGTDPEIRLWRKNRSPLQCTQISTGLFSPPRTQCCQGVDLNRNFDWFFGQVGSSTDPCSEIYSGPGAFSEPETRAVRDFISQLGASRIRTFLTFHSYSQILMYSFGHALRTYPQDVDDLSSTAQRASQALQSVYGTRYTVGTGADTLYPASGGSEDWAKGRMGVKFSYLFELRPEDNVYDGFLLPENQILPTARETWEAVKIIAGETLRQFPPVSAAGGSTTSLQPGAPTQSQNQRVCRDLEQLCVFWAQSGACGTWPSMRERCPAACGFC